MFRSAITGFAAMFIVSLAVGASAQTQTSPAPAGSTPAAPSDSALAAAFWDSIRDSNDPALIEEYLRRYPDHASAPAAWAKLSALRGQPGPQTTTTQPGQPALTQQQLAVALQTRLKTLRCYTRSIDGDGGRGSRAALHRFKAMAGARFAADVPTQEALVAVTNWNGGNCKVVAMRKTRKVTKRKTTRTYTPPPPSGGFGGLSVGGPGVVGPGGGSINIIIGKDGIGIGH